MPREGNDIREVAIVREDRSQARFQILWLARTVQSFAIKTYAAAGAPAEILHPFTGALIVPLTLHMTN